MPSSNILLFDANKANMMADEQYSTNTQRLNGVQSGIASSQLQNKTLYQVSLVAYAIAQIMNQNGLDANDTAAVSAFVANLSGTMLQKVADLATTQEAQAGVVTGKWMSPALVKAAMDTYTANKWLPLTGGTMQGNLILNADPTTNLGAATKQYVDNNVGIDSYKLINSGNYNLEYSGTFNMGNIPSDAIEILLYISGNNGNYYPYWGSSESGAFSPKSSGYYKAVRFAETWSVVGAGTEYSFLPNYLYKTSSMTMSYSGTFKLYYN